MIVAVVTVRVVQVAVHQIVNVVAVGDGRMATVRAMDMAFFVAAADMFWGASIRVGGGHFEGAFVHMPCVGVVEMAVVQIVNMVTVLNGLMTAARTMHVRMVFVDHMSVHGVCFLFGEVVAGCGWTDTSAVR